jgi:hypothetical protein
MATTTRSTVRVVGEAPFKPSAMRRLVQILQPEEAPTGTEKLPLELRLKRQREIIHARRGELKHFLSPRGAPFGALRPIPQVADVAGVGEVSSRAEKVPLEVRLKRQREIIHARRGYLKGFLSPR